MSRLIKWFAGTTILLAGNLYSQSVEVTWDKNRELDLAGYIVYYGDESRLYSYSVNVGLDTQVSITNSTYFEYGKTYYFAVTAFDSSMNESLFSDEVSIVIDEQYENFDPSQTPKEYRLNQNYPNPFNPITTIAYRLPHSSEVVLTIHNLLGQEVRRLVSEIQAPGNKWMTWDGRDNQGDMVGAGVYIYSIRTGTTIETRKMVRLP